MSGETKSLGKKDQYDRFYTKDSVVQLCLSKLDLSSYSVIIEPSAGNGAFSHYIPNCIALDLAPAANDIMQCDYFQFNYAQYQGDGKILVIGNPPFGEQCKLALDFFNRSSLYADTIAFILPSSFAKISIQNRLSLNFILREQIVLPKNSFTLNNEDYDASCVFQIWDRTNEPRKKIKNKMTSEYFEFTKDREMADFRIQRVGGNAGKAFLDTNAAISSNYYIINHSNLDNADFIEKINQLTYWSINFTVGPKSLPKGELIETIESEIFKQF